MPNKCPGGMCTVGIDAAIIKDHITSLKLFPVVCCCGKDGNGLKLEKIGPFFHVLMLSSKINKKVLWLALPDKIQRH